MDYDQDFEIGKDGQHFMLYYGVKVAVSPPLKPLREMNPQEYGAYFYSVLPILSASPEYQQRRIELHEGAERFAM